MFYVELCKSAIEVHKHTENGEKPSRNTNDMDISNMSLTIHSPFLFLSPRLRAFLLKTETQMATITGITNFNDSLSVWS